MKTFNLIYKSFKVEDKLYLRYEAVATENVYIVEGQLIQPLSTLECTKENEYVYINVILSEEMTLKDIDNLYSDSIVDLEKYKNTKDILSSIVENINVPQEEQKPLFGININLKEKDIDEFMKENGISEEVLQMMLTGNPDDEVIDSKIEEKHLNIKDVYNDVTSKVIGQDQQIKSILTSIYKNRDLYDKGYDLDFIMRNKTNILIKGDTGVGKTETLRRIADIFQTGIVIEDASNLTASEYQGAQVEEMLHDLYLKCNKDQEKANRGIIVLDEIDKLSSRFLGAIDNGAGTTKVQQELLKLIEGKEVSYTVNRISNKKILFDTRGITFIAMGSFDGLETKAKLHPEDLVKYGMLKEFVGRFKKFIEYNPASIAMLENIMKTSKISALLDMKNYLAKRNIELLDSDEYIKKVAKEAYELQGGARSIQNIIERDIEDYLFKIYSDESGKKRTLELK